MKNWSIDEKQLKQYPEEYKLWRLEQLINYGLEEDEKIKKSELIKYWNEIKDSIDPYKKRYLEYLLWQKVFSLPDNLTFWNLSAGRKN